MRIGTRLFLSLSVPLVLVVVLFGYLSQQRNRALFQEELSAEGRSIARVAQMAMEDAIRDHQLEDARELVDQLAGFERVLGFRLFERDGTLVYQSTSLRVSPPIPAEALQRVLRERKSVEIHEQAGGKPVDTFILPLSDPQGYLLGAVQILQTESFTEKIDRISRNSIAAVSIVMILAMGAVIFLVTHLSVGRPVEELVRSFREVGSGELRSRVSVRRADEFGRLAQEFNSMGERLEAAQRSLLAEQEERRRAEASLRNAERLASLGRLAAGLAHEIGTPLNVIGGRAEALLRKLEGNDLAEKNLRIIAAQIERIARIVRGMLDFARVPEPRLAPTQVGAVVCRVLELLEERLERGGVRAEIDLPTGLPDVIADADQLHQVFLNLAANALDAMPRGGTLSVRAGCARRPPNGEPGPERDFLVIDFQDTGTGIASEHIGHVFDPFFSTKDVGKGTGLGLSISYGIVREHGGWIDVHSEAGRGSRLSVYLPLGEAPAAAAAPLARAS